MERKRREAMAMQRRTVREIMSSEVVTITRHASCDVAIDTMGEHDVRRLPVVGSNGRLIGIITMHQAELAMPEGTSFWSSGEEKIPEVKDVMTDFVYTVEPDASIGRAAQMMANHKIGALPVVEGDRLVGILTESDLFRFLARQMPPEAGEAD